MSDPTDKVRVIRLIKKPQKPPPDESPPEKELATDSEAIRREPRSDRPPRGLGERPGFERKGFHSDRGPRDRDRSFRDRDQSPRGRGPRDRGPQRRPSAPPARPPEVVLTDEQRSMILELYRSMVLKNERPPEGRRKKIAGRLSVPYMKVAEVVRNYITRDRYRRTNFDIEKAYWQAVQRGEKSAREISQGIAERVQMDEGRIWWWLGKLHEPRKAFAKDPDVSQEARAVIIREYEAYLQQEEPPEKGLHLSLSEQIEEVTPRQVHKVLWEYRMEIWGTLNDTERQDQAPAEPAE